jgi:DNA-binding response OmpR family regulator
MKESNNKEQQEMKKLIERKPVVLIVEDDENIRETLKNILEENGYVVDTAKTGREAEEKAKAKFYNILLLDIKLPDVEGTQLLAKLHLDAPKTMKIMVTGYPSLENAVEALNKGADAYVTKPVKPAKLLGIMKEKLNEQQQAEKMTEGKVTDWIKDRVQKLAVKDS